MSDPEFCPTCGRAAECRCRCPLGDRRCGAGHEWHCCPHCGAVVARPGRHEVPTAALSNMCDACSYHVTHTAHRTEPG